MTDQEILEALGVAAASKEMQDSLLQNIYTVVELRAMSAIGDLITEDQMAHLEQMEKDGSTKDEMLWWLGENVASAHETIDAMMRDYVEEVKEKAQRLQGADLDLDFLAER